MPEPMQTSNPANPAPDAPAAPEAVDWAAHIPADLATEKVWEPLRNKPLGEVLKGYAHSQKMIGGSVRVPGADAKPEEIAAFRKTLGVPDTADAYDIKLDVPEGSGLAIQPERMAKFREAAHKHGLTPAQAQAMVDVYRDTVVEGKASFDVSAKQATETLRQEWGGAFDSNLAAAKQTLRKYGGEQLAGFLEATGLGNHPELIRFMAHVGHDLKEDGRIDGATQAEVTEAQGKLDTILNDRKHAFYSRDKNDPAHKAAVAEVTRLNDILSAADELRRQQQSV